MLARCSAKVNLHLDVVRKREDGYHDIESIFLSVTLFDLLRVEESYETKLVVDGPAALSASRLGIDLEKGNILFRVWEVLHGKYGIPSVSISLTKNIPVGAGLGGGSSDAAGLLLSLDRMFRLNLGREELLETGRAFGADVPFFLEGGAAAVRGIGDVIENFKAAPGLFVLVVWPGVPSPTAEAYRRVRLESRGSVLDDCRALVREMMTEKSLAALAARFRNSFEEEVSGRIGRVAELVSDMKKFSEAVRMSGSGSAVFSLFLNEQDARAACGHLRRKYEACFVCTPSPSGVELS